MVFCHYFVFHDDLPVYFHNWEEDLVLPKSCSARPCLVAAPWAYYNELVSLPTQSFFGIYALAPNSWLPVISDGWH